MNHPLEQFSWLYTCKQHDGHHHSIVIIAICVSFDWLSANLSYSLAISSFETMWCPMFTNRVKSFWGYFTKFPTARFFPTIFAVVTPPFRFPIRFLISYKWWKFTTVPASLHDFAHVIRIGTSQFFSKYNLHPKSLSSFLGFFNSRWLCLCVQNHGHGFYL